MITLHQTPILALLVVTLASAMHPPVQAQSTGSDRTMAQIDAVMPTGASAVDTPTAQAFDAALQDYERCHWRLAFEQLVLLADRGHPQSARIVMQMHRHGPALYGEAFVLLPGQVERFARARQQARATQPTKAL